MNERLILAGRIALGVLILAALALETAQAQSVLEPGVFSAIFLESLPPRQAFDPEATFMGPQGAVKSIEGLDSVLSMLIDTDPAEAVRLAENMGWTFDGEMIEVVIEPETVGCSETISKDSVLAVGGVVTGESRSLLRVALPVERLEEAALSIEGFRLIRPPMQLAECDVVSEGADLVGANTWHRAGFDGTGVKVAVIDGGFIGLDAAVSNGDIPASYIGRDETGRGLQSRSAHGTAVAEAICDMAPGVTLYLIRMGDDVDLENAKDYCKAQGVHIINHSIIWWGDSDFDGTGSICAIADDANANGILWVNAAGNQARNHCQAHFVDSGDILDYSNLRAGGVKPLTNFPESFYGPIMYVTHRTEGTNLYCALTWDAWSESGQDYDLFLYQDGVGWIAGSYREQTTGDSPTESISVTVPASGWYAFGVTKYSASRDHRLNLFVSSRDSYIEIEDLPNRIAPGSIRNPAVSDNVFCVAAIDEDEWVFGPQEGFSSQGPTNGGLIKPDLCGPDDCNSYTWGEWAGTSQSSPHVAGAAALVKHAHPSYTNAKIRAFLENHAIDLGTPGKDNVYGWGKLSLSPMVVMTSAVDGPTNVSPIPVTVAFGQSVIGFEAGDIVTGNCRVSNFAGAGANYTFDLTPLADGLVTADIPADVATNNTGIGNEATAQFSRIYDSVPPTVAMASLVPNPTNTSPIPILVTVTFSEPVRGFADTDIVVTNGTLGNFVDVGGSIYTFDLTPSGDGLVTVDIAANVATDATGNGNNAALTFSRTYDTVRPTVAISSAALDETDTSPIPVSVTFSEPVTGFVAGDITLTNGEVSNFGGSGSTYTFDLTPSGDGLVIADIAADIAADAAGNGNDAAPQFSRTFLQRWLPMGCHR